MCKSQMSWRKLFNLIMQVEFYNILKTIFALKLGWINFNSMSLSQTIMHFLPIINATYWFITCYVIIYLLYHILIKQLIR